MARTPRRANYTVATVRALINFAIDLGYAHAGSNPARRIKMYRERTVERFLTEAEIGQSGRGNRYKRSGQGRSVRMGRPGYGSRCSPAPDPAKSPPSQWAHVDWQRRLIRLPDCKTNEPRTIHLSDAALEVLKTCLASGRYRHRRGKAEVSHTKTWAGLGSSSAD